MSIKMINRKINDLDVWINIPDSFTEIRDSNISKEFAKELYNDIYNNWIYFRLIGDYSTDIFDHIFGIEGYGEVRLNILPILSKVKMTTDYSQPHMIESFYAVKVKFEITIDVMNNIHSDDYPVTLIKDKLYYVNAASVEEYYTDKLEEVDWACGI